MEDFFDKVFSRHTFGLVAKQLESINDNDRQMQSVQEKTDFLEALLRDSRSNYCGLPDSTTEEIQDLIISAKRFAATYGDQGRLLQFLLSDSAKEEFKEFTNKLDYQADVLKAFQRKAQERKLSSPQQVVHSADQVSTSFSTKPKPQTTKEEAGSSSKELLSDQQTLENTRGLDGSIQYEVREDNEVDLAALKTLIVESVNAASEQIGDVMYNHNIMEFLFQQMKNLSSILENIGVDPVFPIDDEQWKMVCEHLTEHLQKGKKMIERHSKGFDMREFYTVSQAQRAVHAVCEAIQQFLAGWNWEIQNDIPDEIVLKDEAFLKSCLEYIFGNDTKNFGDEDEQKWIACQPKWETAKSRFEELLEHLEISNDEDIKTGDKIAQSGFPVYRAEYKGKAVAVKKFGEFELHSAAELIDFGAFFSEASTQAILEHTHIAKLKAVTWSGMLIMELATCDLAKLCQRGHGLNLKTKITILRQVAGALEYMHSRNPPVAHCDIKSSNILIFGDLDRPDSWIAKISDFGSVHHDQWTASLTVRFPGATALWMAPELYNNKHPTVKSDIYSFGLVMYELVSEMELFAGLSPEAVLNAKQGSNSPCPIPRDCPQELVQLMKDCSKFKPKDRPAISEVVLRLRDIAVQHSML